MKLESYFIIIIGILLKIIDDFYDMKIYNNKIVNIAQIGIVLLCGYVFLKNKNFTLMTLITCIYIWFAEGQMSDCDGKSVIFYYVFNVITLGFFLYQAYTLGYSDTFKSVAKDSKEIVRILLFGFFIYFENKWVPEDISKRKIVIRIMLLLLALLYIYYEEHYNSRTIIMKNIYLLAIGYMAISIVNMLTHHQPPNQPEDALASGVSDGSTSESSPSIESGSTNSSHSDSEVVVSASTSEKDGDCL